MTIPDVEKFLPLCSDVLICKNIQKHFPVGIGLFYMNSFFFFLTMKILSAWLSFGFAAKIDTAFANPQFRSLSDLDQIISQQHSPIFFSLDLSCYKCLTKHTLWPTVRSHALEDAGRYKWVVSEYSDIQVKVNITKNCIFQLPIWLSKDLRFNNLLFLATPLTWFTKSILCI